MQKIVVTFFVLTLSIFAQTTSILNINKLQIPFDNQGILCDVQVDSFPAGGRFTENNKHVIYSAGFFLSGKNEDTIWANASADRILDYQPGNVDSIPTDPKYKIYVLKKADNDFSQSWIDWKEAVKLGADFYDGDGDGIYNPADLNSNNQWDPNEDKPDIIGDFTAWCVYNDGTPANSGMLLNNPLGIEIQQTLFAFKGDNSEYDGRDYTFFVRYKIINNGKVSDSFDSVYFGGWADTDLGEDNDAFFDDLAGCDTVLNSGYIYNDGEDGDWGINPPAHIVKILQGPYSYIPGETYTDNNLNNKYDEGIDIPLDSAFNYKGELGTDIIQGAKNLGMTSFIHYMSAWEEPGDPYSQSDARLYMLGKSRHNEFLDPCNWRFGDVLGSVDCSEVNPVFMYSGDPASGTGWINNYPYDQHQLVNTGPFKFEVGKPVNIIVAHIAARGYDAINSLAKAKIFSSNMDSFLKSNFTDLPVGVNPENPVLNSFELYQNYPNPFNPITTIKYQIPETGRVIFKIYDMLGQEVKTLVNKEQTIGSYEIFFDASSLSSGIYFYELRTENFSSVKKMILIK